MTTYALTANPNEHYYPTRLKEIDLIILHVTAGLQDLDMQGADHSARGTNRYGATTKTQASWHACVDSDSIDPALPDTYTAFHCKGYNSNSLGLEISNKDAKWRNKPKAWVEATLRKAAEWCHPREKKYKIPRRLLTKKQVDAGERGYSYHMFLDPSRRSDPGKDFPWSLFVKMLEELDGKVKSPSGSVAQQPAAPVSYTRTGPGGRKNVVWLQKHLNATPDNRWGPDTDKRFLAVRDATRFHNRGFPFGVKFTQSAVGTRVDGDWGPKSEVALMNTVRDIQVTLKNMGYTKQNPTGRWGMDTERAFKAARRELKL